MLKIIITSVVLEHMHLSNMSIWPALHVMDGQKLLGNVSNVTFGKSLETHCI